MRSSRFFRVLGSRPVEGGYLTSYYDGDVLCEAVWFCAEPKAGDLFEIRPGQASPQLVASSLSASSSLDQDTFRWRHPLSEGALSRMELLRRRHKIRSSIRSFLDSEDFLEIDAPLLVKGASPDVAIDSFSLGDGLYLTSSTEYQMKRLALGGFEKIYSFTQNFRKGDTGTFRNPEFTMLEWGRVGEDMSVIEADCEKIVLAALATLGMGRTLTYAGAQIDMSAPWERLTVCEAVQRLTGETLDYEDVASCRRCAEASGLEIRAAWSEDRDFLFSLLMDQIQPRLGRERPVFLVDWPMFQTTSAGARKDRKVAERSELYIAGIEISDGFAGVTDAALQRAYFEQMQSLRPGLGLSPVELDRKYLEAMQLGAPYGAGMALGFDRLVMLLTDQRSIQPVLAFGFEEL